MTTLRFKFSNEAIQLMEELQERTSSTSKGEVISKALALLDITKDKTLILRSADGTEIKVSLKFEDGELVSS